MAAVGRSWDRVFDGLFMNYTEALDGSVAGEGEKAFASTVPARHPGESGGNEPER
jgi:hypothetical protein